MSVRTNINSPSVTNRQTSLTIIPDGGDYNTVISQQNLPRTNNLYSPEISPAVQPTSAVNKSVFVPIYTILQQVPQPVSKPAASYKPHQNSSNVNIGYTKPFTYDGKSDWVDYRVHFDTVSKLNNWPDKIKVLKIISCMQGAALATVGHIDTNNPPSYNDLMQTLNKRFSPPNQSEKYMTQIDARIRRRGESLPELAQDIKRLVRLANPTAPLDVQDNLAYRAFRNALNDQELEWAIVQTSTDTIDEALHLALKYEAYHLSRKRPSLIYQTNEPNTKSSKTSYTKE
ncbi:unnamed protein product [Mytilus edulis]|uniref:Gag protein n=1 Tax=Mytilus edulis TaxID=6550 RepID=A0A8S3PTI1_MYTED|nr:unnamed protein product [Mytilus edulis]